MTDRQGRGARRDPAVPRLPRSGWRLQWADVFRIAMLALMLVGVLVMRAPCAQGVAQFVGSFSPVDAGPAIPAPLSGPLRPLTDEEIRAHFRPAARADAGPGPGPGPGPSPDR